MANSYQLNEKGQFKCSVCLKQKSISEGNLCVRCDRFYCYSCGSKQFCKKCDKH